MPNIDPFIGRKREIQELLALLEKKNSKFSCYQRAAACLPALIHVNGVADSVTEKHFFFSIIDFKDLLKD